VTHFGLSLTNGTSRPIELNGFVRVSYLDERGNELSADSVTPVGRPAQLPQMLQWSLIGDSDAVRRVRVKFLYSYDADPFSKSVSVCLGAIDVRPPFCKAYPIWLWHNGLIDGKVRRNYDGIWLGPSNKIHQSPDQLVRIN
jgi:hypothetical protein